MLSKYLRATRLIRLGGGRVEFYYINSIFLHGKKVRNPSQNKRTELVPGVEPTKE